MMAWYKPGSTSGYHAMLAAMSNSYGSTSWPTTWSTFAPGVAFHQNNQTVYGEYTNNSGGGGGFSNGGSDPTGNVLTSTSTWYHVAVTVEKTGTSTATYQIYIDGTLVKTVNDSGTTWPTVALNLMLGAVQQSYSPTSGSFACWRAWQSKLTGTEIAAEKDSAAAVKASAIVDVDFTSSSATNNGSGGSWSTSSTGTWSYNASGGPTLSGGAATVSATLTGSLGGLSATTSAAVSHSATLTAATGALSASVSAGVSHSATLGATLGGVSGSITSVVSHETTLSGSLGALAASMSATASSPPVNATLAGAFGGLSGSATAVVSHPATFSGSLGALAASVNATVTHAATFAGSFGGLVGTTGSTVTKVATFTSTLGGLSGNMTAAPVRAATMAGSLGGVSAAATFTVSAPPSYVKPDSTNTGYIPTGVSLTAWGGSNTITSSQTIDSKSFTGQIIIDGCDVTITRSLITCGAYFGIRTINGGTLNISDTEINMTGGLEGSYGISGANITALRLNIHGADNGGGLYSDSSLTSSYIHGMTAPGTAHPDGFECNGGASNVSFIGNNFDCTSVSCTSSLMTNNDWGAISGLTIANNWFAGGGYNLYLDTNFSGTDALSDVRVYDNHFSDYTYGPVLTRGNYSLLQITEWHDNWDDTTDSLVANPNGSGEVGGGPDTISATFTGSLGGLSGALTAGVSHSVTAVATIGGLTATATASVSHAAVMVGTLGGLSGAMVASSAPTVTAVFAAVLGGITASGSATVIHPAVPAAVLGGLSGTSTFTVVHAANFSGALGGLVGSMVATVPSVQATFAASLGPLTGSMSATPFSPATGSSPPYTSTLTVDTRTSGLVVTVNTSTIGAS